MPNKIFFLTIQKTHMLLELYRVPTLTEKDSGFAKRETEASPPRAPLFGTAEDSYNRVRVSNTGGPPLPVSLWPPPPTGPEESHTEARLLRAAAAGTITFLMIPRGPHS